MPTNPTLTIGSRPGPALSAIDAGLAVGFVVLWSSGFIGAELGTRSAAAFTLLAWRAIVATVILHGWRVRRPRAGRRRLSRREIGTHAVIGLLGQSGYLLGVVVAVEQGVPAGTVALVASLQPLVSGIAARPVLGDRVSLRQWLALIVGLAGVALVVGGDLTATSAIPGWVYLLPVLAMLSLVAATLYERKSAPSTDLVDGLSIQTSASAVAFVAVAAGSGELLPPADGGFWLAVGWTVVLSHLGGYAFYWLNVRRGGATRVGVLMYLTPAATLVWAAMMFHETITGLIVVGMLVSAASVAFFLGRRGVGEPMH